MFFAGFFLQDYIFHGIYSSLQAFMHKHFMLSLQAYSAAFATTLAAQIQNLSMQHHQQQQQQQQVQQQQHQQQPQPQHQAVIQGSAPTTTTGPTSASAVDHKTKPSHNISSASHNTSSTSHNSTALSHHTADYTFKPIDIPASQQQAAQAPAATANIAKPSSVLPVSVVTAQQKPKSFLETLAQAEEGEDHDTSEYEYRPQLRARTFSGNSGLDSEDGFQPLSLADSTLESIGMYDTYGRVQSVH